MNYEIFVDDISSISIDSTKKQTINTLNSHSYVTAKSDEEFNMALHAYK